MDQKSIEILYKRYEWMSYRLEREAYRKQMEGRTKPLKHFLPCEKALVFTRAMGEPSGVVTSLVIPTAARTICACHPALGEADLWRLYAQAEREIPQ